MDKLAIVISNELIKRFFKETPAEYKARCLKAWAEKAKVDVTIPPSNQE